MLLYPSGYFSAARMKLSPSDLYCVTTINHTIPSPPKVKVITPNPKKQSRSPEEDEWAALGGGASGSRMRSQTALRSSSQHRHFSSASCIFCCWSPEAPSYASALRERLIGTRLLHFPCEETSHYTTEGTSCLASLSNCCACPTTLKAVG